jgi:hypothetical protein
MEEFDNLEIEYELRDLQVLAVEPPTEPTPKKESTPSPPSAPPSKPQASTELRRAVEALRFGLVPPAGIEQLTIGFQELSRWIESRLPYRNGEAPTLSEVCGPFGTGKSHTMAIVRYVAQKLGYVTAHVEVDGRLVSLSDPAHLLSALWSNARIDGHAVLTPLLDLYVKAIERNRPPPSHPSLPQIREYYAMVRLLMRSGCLDTYAADLDGLISSNPNVNHTILADNIGFEPNISQPALRLRRMISTRVAERPKDFVQSLVGHAMVAHLAGYRGLVVTIDEFEVEHLDKQRFARAAGSLLALEEYLGGRTGVPAAPLALFVASVGQEGHVGDDLIDSMIRQLGSEPYELSPISPAAQHSLAERIHSIYCDAYAVADPRPDRLIDRINDLASVAAESESGFTRAFIKSFVSACDVSYGPSGYTQPS